MVCKALIQHVRANRLSVLAIVFSLPALLLLFPFGGDRQGADPLKVEVAPSAEATAIPSLATSKVALSPGCTAFRPRLVLPTVDTLDASATVPWHCLCPRRPWPVPWPVPCLAPL